MNLELLSSRLLRAMLAAILFQLSFGIALSQTFTKITTISPVTELGAWRSVNWVDYDGDGNLDLFVTRGKAGGQDNVLFRNDGAATGTFTRMSDLVISQDHMPSDGSSWADYDNDGSLDAFTANWYGLNNLLFKNDGDGSFTRILSGSIVTDGGYSETGTWGDYNNDGLVDLYVANSAGAKQNFLYKNLGNGQFERIMSGSPVTDIQTSRGVTWVDYDGDGDLDLFVANESGENESLYKNMLKESGVDTFKRVTGDPLVTSGGSSWSGSWADYDNDGDQDVFVVNQGGQPSIHFINNGDGSFTPLSSGSITTDDGYGASAAWADMDNDGDLDLVVSHAYAGSPVGNYLYKNLLIETGTPTLERVTTGPVVTDPGYSYGLSWGDYDEDGDLDLFVARTLNENQTNALYRNDGDVKQWLTVECRGTHSNASAIGATIRAKAIIGGKPVWQMRVIEGQSGYCGQNLQAHFGFGDAAIIDSLVIGWPSGSSSIYTSVSPDRHVRIVEDRVGTLLPELPAENFITQSDTIRFAWHRDICGAPYHIQIATDPRFAQYIVYEDATIPDTQVTVRGLPVNSRYYWRIRATRSIDEDQWSGLRDFAVAPLTFTFDVPQRWNLISVPLATPQRGAADLFPDARSAMIGYDGGGYVPADSLMNLRGYWVKFNDGQAVSLTGQLLLQDTIAVDSGWNMIGSLSYPVSTASLVSDPADNIASNFFSYDRGYVHADSLKPWKGYWVKARHPGSLTAQVGGNSSQKLAAVPQGSSSLTIEDREGRSQVLYCSPISLEAEFLDRYTLPPLPPHGIFDARFSSGRYLEAIEGRIQRSYPIRITSAEFPIKIRWNVHAGQYDMILRTHGASIPMQGTGGATVMSPDGIELQVKGRESLPHEFALDDNFPNPFNPATLIRYQLPVVERSAASLYNVSLKIYDVLGQLVTTLVDGMQEPGEYSVSWNAGAQASGFFFYRIEAVSVAAPAHYFSQVKKALLVK